MNAILQRDKRTADDVAPTPHDADAFLRYFDEKVKSARAGTASDPLTVFNSTAEVLLSTLRRCSEDEVRRLITASPTKSCALDPIPTFLLKEMVDVLLPYVTAMINASPREGRLPSSDDAMTSLAARGSIAVAVHTSIPKQLPPSPLPLFTPSLTNATLFITACPLQVSDPAPTDPELTCTCCCQINQIQ